MKTKIFQLALISSVLLLASATMRRSSSGAPASHTGAPGEQTCAVSGCHDDNKLNSGTAVVDISVGDKLSHYEAGKTYPVTVRISDPNVARFGFQIVALEGKEGKDMGSFQLVDTLRTQIVQNEYKLKERKYVTYTFSGTDAVSTGKGEWTVNWTAPENGKKPVTFYVAAVSANDDESDKGDKVYTSSLTISKK